MSGFATTTGTTEATAAGDGSAVAGAAAAVVAATAEAASILASSAVNMLPVISFRTSSSLPEKQGSTKAALTCRLAAVILACSSPPSGDNAAGEGATGSIGGTPGGSGG